MSLYTSNKQQVQDIKKFLKPNTLNKIQGDHLSAKAKRAGEPANRVLPVRGVKL